MDRISFVPLTEGATEKNIGEIRKRAMSHPDFEEALALLFELNAGAEEYCQECCGAVYGDFVVGRFYDGDRYIFTFPIPFSDGATEEGCRTVLKALAEYSVRELIPLYLSDVPREYLELLCDVFPKIDAACYEDDEDLFSVLVLNECLELSRIPEKSMGDVTLKAIDVADGSKYFELCTNEEVSKYWGYNVIEDLPSIDAEGLLREAQSEFERGVAISFGVYKSDVYAGEAIIFNFDYFGGAEIAIRLLPWFQGKGLGSAVLGLLIGVSKEIGLKLLNAQVKAANISSFKMTGKHMQENGSEGDAVKFYLSLES